MRLNGEPKVSIKLSKEALIQLRKLDEILPTEVFSLFESGNNAKVKDFNYTISWQEHIEAFQSHLMQELQWYVYQETDQHIRTARGSNGICIITSCKSNTSKETNDKNELFELFLDAFLEILKHNKSKGKLPDYFEIQEACKSLKNVEFIEDLETGNSQIEFSGHKMHWLSIAAEGLLISDMQRLMDNDPDYTAIVRRSEGYIEVGGSGFIYLLEYKGALLNDGLKQLHRTRLEATLYCFKHYLETEDNNEEPSEDEHILYGMIEAQGYEHTYKLLQKAQERHEL